MTYQEPDLSELRTIPLANRLHKVGEAHLARPPGEDRSLAAFLESLPDVLAARDFRKVVDHLAAAANERKGIVLLLGGHVVKVGLGPLILRWLERGVVSHIALNGAAAIHDFELAAYGGTSEDVEAGLADGSFGMAEETGREMNAAIAEAHRTGGGFAEGLAEYLARRGTLALSGASVLLGCRRHGVPVTGHPTIGAEINHQHPSADGAALGGCAMRDFRRLAGSLPRIDRGGAVLNWGSAVVLPEVFLKALAISRNLNEGAPRAFLAADFDMIRHYRPAMNVVRRPTRDGGTGVQITGHHELMLPLLVWSLLERL